MQASPLLAVPNVSEGRDPDLLASLARAFGAGDGARLLDLHADADHDRSVFTLAGAPAALVDALVRGAAVAVERLDVVGEPLPAQPTRGQHPRVGALDVAPIVYLRDADRGLACATALVLGDRLGEQLGLPVFLYGELTASHGAPPRTRAGLRRGGVAGLAARLGDPADPLRPDFGPARLHRTAGASLVAARAPLVAFNLQLAAPASFQRAQAIAAEIREGGEAGMPGLRAIAILLKGATPQVSMNVERPYELPLAEIVAAVRSRAPVSCAEIVGLVPRTALEGFPQDIAIAGFDPARHILENALGC